MFLLDIQQRRPRDCNTTIEQTHFQNSMASPYLPVA
jgi:hypothetical protein